MISIEFETEYLPNKDMTIIFENVYEMKKRNKNHIRERICGFYYGEPNKNNTEYYLDKGCEGIVDDNGLLISLIKDE